LIQSAFTLSFSQFRVSKHPFDKLVLEEFQKRQSKLYQFIFPLTVEAYFISQPFDAKIPHELIAMWNSIYPVFCEKIEQKTFDRFIELVPFFLSFVVHHCLFEISPKNSFHCLLGGKLLKGFFSFLLDIYNFQIQLSIKYLISLVTKLLTMKKLNSLTNLINHFCFRLKIVVN
jgi:hypothetical protein